MEITAHYLVAEISTPPDSQVLRSAQQVANVASSTSWITCHPPQPATSSGPTTAYEYSLVPPPCPTSPIAIISPTKQWNATPEVKEVYALSELRPFNGTDFSYLRTFSHKSKDKGKQVVRSEQIEEFSGLQPRSQPTMTSKKRKRLHDQRASSRSIYSILPEPYYHPTILQLEGPTPPPPPNIHRIPIFPVHATLNSAAERALNSRFSRTAWFVPIQGDVPSVDPKYNLTPAILVDSVTTESGSTIQWTAKTLAGFWGFLLKTQACGSLGPLGISLEPVGVRKVYEDISIYIKVYHEARYAMRVRTVLDCYKEYDGEDEKESLSYSARATRMKRRVLKGAKLLLVDELGKPGLIS